MKTTKIVCDIELCIHEATTKPGIPIVFNTEQTEGGVTEPYLVIDEMDLCSDHYERLMEALPISSWGSMGNNKYIWNKENYGAAI